MIGGSVGKSLRKVRVTLKNSSIKQHCNFAQVAQGCKESSEGTIGQNFSAYIAQIDNGNFNPCNVRRHLKQLDQSRA